MAARAGHTEVAKYLLQNKAKANAKAKVSLAERKGRVESRPPQPGDGSRSHLQPGARSHQHPHFGQALLRWTSVRDGGLFVGKWCFCRITGAQRAGLSG